ncbi:MAG: hypothetical protein P8Y28_05560 [Gammaproteobacteria bacterium]|jgi:FtsZ-binding cell division protein ZapB
MKRLTNHKVAFFLLALIPMVFWIVVSCSSAPKKVELTEETTAHWNASVEKTIKEPERAAKVKELGQQLIDVSKDIQQDIEALNQKMITLNENYDASKEELQQMLGEFEKTRNPKFDQYRDIIFAMRSEVSAEEWKHLMK